MQRRPVRSALRRVQLGLVERREVTQPVGHRMVAGALGQIAAQREPATETEAPVGQVVVAAPVDERAQRGHGGVAGNRAFARVNLRFLCGGRFGVVPSWGRAARRSASARRRPPFLLGGGPAVHGSGGRGPSPAS